MLLILRVLESNRLKGKAEIDQVTITWQVNTAFN